MDETQEREITLGVGKLLGLFFGLVVLCGVFFGIGYSVGRGASKPADGSLIAANPAAAAPVPNSTKPIAGQAGQANQQASASKPSDCQSGSDCGNGGGASQELGFYHAVEQKDPNTQLTPPPTKQPTPPPATQKNLALETRPTPTTGFMVQIAAVSKEEDAVVLRDALRHKQYPVVVTTNAGDRLYHVQVGPFPNLNDAENMRLKLVGDGYNPILKH